MTADEKTTAESNGGPPSGAVIAPSISLPKGGGAIRGMGEKFAANPVTGTGSMSVPIATSPGRSGFGPQLSLSYDSGAGNGPFGFGWNLSLPAITRKTDKGLPRYWDAEESDVFILSGSEDLVPVYRQDPDGTWVAAHSGFQRDVDGFWVRDSSGHLVIHDDPRTLDGDSYSVRRYRPRIEGLFARIERWTNTANGEMHWRSISKDNITTLYGKHNKSRIFDPAELDKDDPGDLDKAHPTRIFTWLICQSYDDKGNAIVYEYQAENSQRIFEDQHGQPVALAHERNRSDATRSAVRYLKRIKYGNRTPNRDFNTWQATDPTQLLDDTWMFEVVFDYGEGHYTEAAPDAAGRVFAQAQTDPPLGSYWPVRLDPFSTYRAGFEVRTYRLCQRVLMFHHIPDLAGGAAGYDGLVRSTDFDYSSQENPQDVPNPIYSFLFSVTQSGYKRQPTRDYLKKSLPPVEFTYSEVEIEEEVHEVDPTSLENLPIGLDGSAYQWTDLHGEGIPGILTEQAGAWFYKRNLSPINLVGQNGSSRIEACFAPVELVITKPNLALTGGQAQFMDLAGDGQPDLVVMDGPMPGLYEHDEEESWKPFRPFTSRLNRNTHDPNLKFVDLDGDGHADVLIIEDDAFVWHSSLAEEGFGPSCRVAQSFDEEEGPRLVFADGTQSIYLADLSGDGLTDLVRIRNGEVCYWPNLGYGCFGAKVTMDSSPWFDDSDQFDQTRIRLADIDGSGTTDLLYLHRDGVRLYFNQSGNSWSESRPLNVFPRVDDLASIMPTDLLGNGTACLVWSSPLPGDMQRPMRYVDLMGAQKPHLLVKTINNLGAETDVDYAPSTKFYLQDKRDGKPWITRLPFPVHVVEKITTYDQISRNRFVTHYSYHHGYFDGEEREFRGFGRVEQTDTEELAALIQSGELPAENVDAASYVPPMWTKTWFHTGVYDEIDEVSQHFAVEYYGAPNESDPDYQTKFDAFFETLLPDSILPDDLTADEEREACRALKGSMLRQEVYALDGTDKEQHPYTVTEQNFTIRTVQQRNGNRHAVFFTHARETIGYHHERNPADPRIQHALTLEVDDYANVLKQSAIAYGRREPDASLPTDTDRDKQTTALLTYTENHVTKDYDTRRDPIDRDDDYRTPLPCETVTFELTGYTPTGAVGRFQASDFVEPDPAFPGRLRHKFTDQVAYEVSPTANPCRRPIEWLRMLYRRDDLNGFLPLGDLQPLALPGESYKLAFTPGLLDQVYVRSGQKLLPDNPSEVLAVDTQNNLAADRGGYVDLDGDGHWWIPSGRSFYSTNPAAELTQARQHFFLARQYRDPFDNDAFVDFDASCDLLMIETRDALGNRVTVEANDYRVLQPRLVSDPNRNQTEVVFDALGLVVGTAVMGKPLPVPVEGDSLSSFVADPTQAQIDEFMTEPRQPSSTNPKKESEATQIVHDLLQGATTRIVYDLDRFARIGEPPFAATIARETHVSELRPGQQSKLQISVSYSDGFGREIQKKIQAEPGQVPTRGVNGNIVIDTDGQPMMTLNDVSPRWVGTGWTVFNNKGKPVRQYEPFFTDTHRFEFDVRIGVSPVIFYDPTERVIATLHPNHTYEKVVFDPWQQTTYDVNDTCAARNAQTGDPRTDPDLRGYVIEYFKTQPNWKTWLQPRIPDPQKPPGDSHGKTPESDAAVRALAHADTPTIAHFDVLGRPFLTLAHNRVVCANHELDGTEESFATRIELDIEGNQRAVRDERKLPSNYLPTGAIEQRVVMSYTYDMLRNRIYQLSMEGGARWMLNDVVGKPIRAWDSRGHNFATAYDALRRPTEQYVLGTFSDTDPLKPNSDPRTLNPPDVLGFLVDKIEYGEPPLHATAAQEQEAQRLNLRTRIYRHFDSAGAATNAQFDANGKPTQAYDFKGNMVRSTRQLVTDYTAIPNWLHNPKLDAESFEGSTRYDALNRPIQAVAPHSSVTRAEHPNKFNVIQPVFNEANLLEQVDVWLEHAAEPTGLVDPANEASSPVGVANIDYDAKGQRLLIDYKNAASTSYSYDPLTFRLTQLLTKRKAADFPGDDPQPPIDGWPGKQVQNLHYIYDPAGNITHIQDDAQQTIYFKNKRVEPSNDYTYDAIYRLIEARGREHLGQVGGSPVPHSYNDAPRVGVLSSDGAGHFAPNDRDVMGTYIERYIYDAVGNFLQMRHTRTDSAVPGWTRRYAYNETSLIEESKQSNRLSRTQVGNGTAAAPDQYLHDAHGNMLRMPHLGDGSPSPDMNWDYKDRLRQINLGGGGTAFYVYDASGQRVRKVVEKNKGNLIEERVYLRGFEIYRMHKGVAALSISSNTVTLERETLHVMDDKQRIALVETRTLDKKGEDKAPQQLIRYQLSNHLSSASLELDTQAQIISYEEYAPYGSSTYQAVRSQTETAKRYRYTGKERDEESGLYCHGARYYAAWLGRWLGSDPIGIADGTNTFAYCRCNPSNNTDPTGRGTEGDDQIYCKAKSEGFIKEHWTEHRTFEEMASKEGWSLPDKVENYLYEHTRTSLSDRQFSQNIKTPSDARIGKGVASGEIPAKEAFAQSLAKNQAELAAAGKSEALRNKAFDLQQAQLRGRVEGVLQARANMKAGLQGKQLYEGVNDAIRAGEKSYFDNLSEPSAPPTEPSASPSVIVDPEATSTTSQPAKTAVVEATPGKTTNIKPDVPAPAEPPAVAGVAEQVADKTEAKVIDKAESVVARGAERGGERLAARILEHAPLVGYLLAYDLVLGDVDRGEYFNAAADAVGPIPGVGELAFYAQAWVETIQMASEGKPIFIPKY